MDQVSNLPQGREEPYSEMNPGEFSAVFPLGWPEWPLPTLGRLSPAPPGNLFPGSTKGLQPQVV